MFRHRLDLDQDTARMLAAVASESRPYTDPQAGYPTAVQYRAQRESVAPQPEPADLAHSRVWRLLHHTDQATPVPVQDTARVDDTRTDEF